MHLENHDRPSSKRRAIPALVALVGAVFSLVGCRGLLGVDGYGTIPCESCMADHCFTEEARCATEPACAALEACLGKCQPDDAECKVTCNLSIRRTSEMSRLIACAAQSCGQCAAAHATFGGLECTECLEETAPDSLKALSSSVAALELEACQQDCSPGFEDQCPCTDLGGGALDGGVGGAAMQQSLREVPMCSRQCSKKADADWSCLGHMQSPPLASSDSSRELLLHVRLATYKEWLKGGSTPSLPDAQVTACTGQPECTDTDPERSALTKKGTGLADLRLLSTGGAYFSDLAVRWSDEDTGRMSTVLLYFFPPLRRTPSWTWRRLVSQDIADVLVDSLDGSKLDWKNDGGIVWSVAACNGVPAEGVTATLVGGTEQIVYVTDAFALSNDLRATSRVGLGAVLRVAPRTLAMVLQAPNGETIGRYEFAVVPGAITTLSFAPVP